MASKISLFLNFDNPDGKKPIPTANCKSSFEFENKGVSDLKVHLDYSYRHAIICEKFEKWFFWPNRNRTVLLTEKQVQLA